MARIYILPKVINDVPMPGISCTSQGYDVLQKLFWRVNLRTEPSDEVHPLDLIGFTI